MAQFDLFKNVNPSTCSLYPYLLDIQSDFLRDLRTTVVIPLALEKDYAGNTLAHLNPSLEVSGEKYLAITTLIAGVERNILGDKITSLADYRDQIDSSLDFMITGI